MDKPKMCPCCGNEAHVIHTIREMMLDVPQTSDYYRVACWGCDLSTGEYESAEVAISAWNERVNDCDRNSLIDLCCEIERAGVEHGIEWAERIMRACGMW